MYCGRFDIFGTHPRARKPAACISAVYRIKEQVCERAPAQQRHVVQDTVVGPGRYDLPSSTVGGARAGGGWERAGDDSRDYGLPTLRQQLRQWNRHEAAEHGPGTYGVVEPPASEAFDGRYLSARGPRMAPENKFEARAACSTRDVLQVSRAHARSGDVSRGGSASRPYGLSLDPAIAVAVISVSARRQQSWA